MNAFVLTFTLLLLTAPLLWYLWGRRSGRTESERDRLVESAEALARAQSAERMGARTRLDLLRLWREKLAGGAPSTERGVPAAGGGVSRKDDPGRTPDR